MVLSVVCKKHGKRVLRGTKPLRVLRGTKPLNAHAQFSQLECMHGSV